MKVLLPSLLSLVLGSALGQSAHGQQRCSSLFTKLDTDSYLRNENATLSPKNYRRPNLRTMTDETRGYFYFLTSDFANQFRALQPGSVIIDSGAGAGAAMLEAASRRHTTYAINGQDTISYLKNLPDTPSNTIMIEEPMIKAIHMPLSDIPVVPETIWDGVKQEAVDTWTTVGMAEQDRARLRTAFYDTLEKFTNQGKFNYLIGYSETQLPGIEARADLLTDAYGGFRIIQSPEGFPMVLVMKRSAAKELNLESRLKLDSAFNAPMDDTFYGIAH